MKKWVVIILFLSLQSALAQEGKLFNVSASGIVSVEPAVAQIACTIVLNEPVILVVFAEAVTAQTNPAVRLAVIQNNQLVVFAANDDWTELSDNNRDVITGAVREVNRDTDAALISQPLPNGSYCAIAVEQTPGGPSGTINVQITDVSARVSVANSQVLNTIVEGETTAARKSLSAADATVYKALQSH